MPDNSQEEKYQWIKPKLAVFFCELQWVENVKTYFTTNHLI
jgi:hypothetical protein